MKSFPKRKHTKKRGGGNAFGGPRQRSLQAQSAAQSAAQNRLNAAHNRITNMRERNETRQYNANEQPPYTQEQIADAEEELDNAARQLRQLRQLRRSRQVQQKKSRSKH